MFWIFTLSIIHIFGTLHFLAHYRCAGAAVPWIGSIWIWLSSARLERISVEHSINMVCSYTFDGHCLFAFSNITSIWFVLLMKSLFVNVVGGFTQNLFTALPKYLIKHHSSAQQMEFSSTTNHLFAGDFRQRDSEKERERERKFMKYWIECIVRVSINYCLDLLVSDLVMWIWLLWRRVISIFGHSTENNYCSFYLLIESL